MNPRLWTLFIVLEDGRELPHWTAESRGRAREFRRNMLEPTSGKMPRGLRTRIRKTFDIMETSNDANF